MRKLIWILLCFVFNSCQMKSQDIKLEGKIAAKRINTDSCTIYAGNDMVNFKLPNNKNLEYDIISWMNKKDVLIGIENYQSPQRATIKSNIVLLDTKGQLIERVHESSSGEYVGVAFSSLSDTLLLFTTRYDNKEHADDIFYAPVNINIADFNKRKVIKQIESFCPRVYFEMAESPWSPDEKHFVYSVSDKRKMKTEGEKEKIRLMPENGIYIYSIVRDEHQRITDYGHYAVWSPKGNYIAYLLEDEIWLYNLSDSVSTRLYKPELYERVKDIHWAPDGEYLFVTCPKYHHHQNMLYSYNEKLLNIPEGKPVNFQKINKGLCWYTWKK